MSGGGRRFVNLVASDGLKGMYSLRRFDLSRNQFFYAAPDELSSHGRDMRLIRRDHLERNPYLFESKKRSQEQRDLAAAEKRKMVGIWLPAPLVSMRSTPCLAVEPVYQGILHCLPLSKTDMLFADSAGQVFHYDAEHRLSMTMPVIGARKEDPLSLTISPEGGGGIGSVYIIERTIWPDRSSQFEALVSERCGNWPVPWSTWQRHELPLPPYVSEPGYNPYTSPIFAAVVLDNRFICVSARPGTYCFDTATRTWSRAGDWYLPFRDKAEYVPELDLWFGLFANNDHLPCAVDLSAIVGGNPLERSLVWGDAHRLPEEWFVSFSSGHAKMVSLGSGRFCILRFFETKAPCRWVTGEFVTDRRFAVFTGIEVVDNGKGSSRKKKGGRLRMVKHKSRLFKIDLTNLSIVSMF